MLLLMLCVVCSFVVVLLNRPSYLIDVPFLHLYTKERNLFLCRFLFCALLCFQRINAFRASTGGRFHHKKVSFNNKHNVNELSSRENEGYCS
eukprot:m.73638 g.73638  ORF g.73638 m.73638 type:complete len:92 (-) comp11777_c0_seq1:1386-1661(-)